MQQQIEPRPSFVIDSYDELKQKLYEKEASRYDRVRFGSVAGQFYAEQANQQIVTMLGEARHGQVLDVATGTGRVALALGQRGISVTGVDISEPMLDRAREKASRAGLTTVRFLQGNARALPFANNHFDAVVAIRFLHIMPPDRQLLMIEEMRRVLRPGGTLVVEFNNAIPFLYANHFTKDPFEVIWPKQLKERLPGFHIIEAKGVLLPVLGRLAQSNWELAWKLAEKTHKAPWAYFSRQLLVRAQKIR